MCDLSKVSGGGGEPDFFFSSIKKKKKKSVLPNLTKNKFEGMTQLEKREKEKDHFIAALNSF